MGKTRLVIIAGPTASGKTALAVGIARLFNGEVVNADSMQVYRHMDIGTAKPTDEERAGIPHHLIDIVSPDEEYTAARFRADAQKAIADIASRGKTPVVAGGTGLYIKALTGGLFAGPQADWELRRDLLETASSRGKEALHEILRSIDPESASRIHPNNLHRIIRAIEVFELSKRPISELQQEHAFSETPYVCLKAAIEMERSALYSAIDSRVERMVEAGLLEETRRLAAMGYGYDLKPMCGLGYKEMCGYLRGEYPFEEAVRLIKRNTRHYAKRQMTWFRKDPEIKWFKPGDSCIIDRIKEFLD